MLFQNYSTIFLNRNCFFIGVFLVLILIFWCLMYVLDFTGVISLGGYDGVGQDLVCQQKGNWSLFFYFLKHYLSLGRWFMPRYLRMA